MMMGAEVQTTVLHSVQSPAGFLDFVTDASSFSVASLVHLNEVSWHRTPLAFVRAMQVCKRVMMVAGAEMRKGVRV